MSRERLDQILIREGLISEEQVKEALTRQKAHGGRLGSQLLYHRYIDEAGLVRALTIQLGCKGVVLSDIEIPEIVVKMIPAKVAVARKVVPFDYIPDANVLKVACEDPTDTDLKNELDFVSRGKTVQLFVAAELSLDTLIARHYHGQEVSLEDRQLLEIPDEATDTGEIEILNADSEDSGGAPKVLLVTDEEYNRPLVQSLLERDGYEVLTTDSADDAIEMIGTSHFHTVFVKDTVSGDYLDLIDRLRKSSPRTKVRYYESSSGLLLNQDSLEQEGDLLVRNLDLLTSLLALHRKIPENHSGAVGHYANLICKKMGLPNKERLYIVNAAYLHDLSKHYYDINDTEDQLSVVRMTAKLLTSINYPPTVVGILKAMYKDLEGKYTKRLPIETLGGNILTIADLFCESFPSNQTVSLDKFDVIKKKCRDLTGRLFLAEVVDVFVDLVQREILELSSEENGMQVMIYSDKPGATYGLEQRVKRAGFATVSQCAEENFLDLLARREPDMIVLMLEGDKDTIISRVMAYLEKTIDATRTPVFLLVQGTPTHELTDLFERGIEDIMAFDVNLDLLVTKMTKIRSKVEGEKSADDQQPQSSGTKGQLTEMNLIDLLQALGPGLKTVKITVASQTTPETLLVLFLNRGQIVYAKVGDLTGAEAVYKGLGWSQGVWSVEPVSESDIPEPNNNVPNESILMEGCRLIDEQLRKGQLI